MELGRVLYTDPQRRSYYGRVMTGTDDLSFYKASTVWLSHSDLNIPYSSIQNAEVYPGPPQFGSLWEVVITTTIGEVHRFRELKEREAKSLKGILKNFATRPPDPQFKATTQPKLSAHVNEQRSTVACPKCGEENVSKALYCESCGNLIHALKCPVCGETNRPWANFCITCGQPLDATRIWDTM